ncbi:MAG: oligopeptide/dipeptide ABC transporter ATP-binding protein, partial [Bacillota bacterium]
PTGCSFSERCNYARDICFKKEPNLMKLDSGHSAACHFAEEFDLQSADHQYKINLNY